MLRSNLLYVNNINVLSIYVVLISACCALLADAYMLTTEDLEDYDNNKRSIQNQNFLTRPRPGKRGIYRNPFNHANEEFQRTMNELEYPYYNKRSEVSQNFLTRPRPGKREVYKVMVDGKNGNEDATVSERSYLKKWRNLEDRHHKRSEESQNFLTRPRPGKRERSAEQNQHFLARPRPGKRELSTELYQNFLVRPRPGKREIYYGKDVDDKENDNLKQFLRELEHYIIKDLLKNKLRK